MTFLDEQGVKPCGHSARDKGILIKVFTSCLSSQVPQQLAFSVHSCKNDKNTGDMMFEGYDSIKPMTTDAQHVIIHDFTKIRCSAATINDQCLCLPHANWSLWSKRERIQVVNDKDHSRETWHILLLSNDDSVILKFFEKSGEGAVNYNDYGDILKSGWGRGPSEEDERDAMSRYDIFDSVGKLLLNINILVLKRWYCAFHFSFPCSKHKDNSIVLVYLCKLTGKPVATVKLASSPGSRVHTEGGRGRKRAWYTLTAPAQVFHRNLFFRNSMVHST